jgi:ATP-dependent helicase HepA
LSEYLFAPGQRWISNTESDLGLGIVEHCDVRRVSVSFPAASEQRTYACDNAPLTRVIYPLGESVSTVDGIRITITARDADGALLRYTGVDADGATRTIEESQLDSFARFSRPQDRLLAGQVDANEHFILRLQTLAHRHHHRCSSAFGLLGARVALLPHQLFIASEVAARHAPRVLLADEVGLGKTIEAGLIVHHQLVSARATRVLFVVPDSLIHQWLVELLRRFNLRVSILDEDRCAALEDSGESNPFDSAQLALCPLSLLAGNALRLNQAVAAGWDLLVVDEAHHLQWSEGHVSSAYAAIEALAVRVPGLLLLTATPEQLGAQGHFARLRLLDPDRYSDAVRFREEESGYHAISRLVEQLVDGVGLADAADVDPLISSVAGYLGSVVAEELRLTLRDEGKDDESRRAVIEHAVRSLLDRHGTGRVLFRNTRDAVGGFPSRRLIAHRLPMSVDVPADAMACMIDPVSALGDDWVRSDRRVAWLDGFLRANPEQRTLVICARSETARSLEEHLRLRCGLRTALFHEGTSLLARDRAAAWFAEPGHDGAQALICSEIGSEGRNFQHASRLVLFDLPTDPELVEQRIGRLDRIGQQRDVEIHVPYTEGGPGEVLLRWYHEALNGFERPCAIGERMREQFSQRLEQCLSVGLQTPAASASLDALVADTRSAAGSMLRELEQGRDRLLELGSCDPGRAAAVVQAVADSSRSRELAAYMEAMFDLFGVEHEASGAQGIVMHAGSHMLCEEFPELPEDGATGTFERKQALAREDIEFLTWEHPMVVGAMDLLVNGEIGNSTLCTFKALPLDPGTLVLESVFVIHCPGPRALGLSRWLPTDIVRHVVTSDGRQLTDALPTATLDRLASPVAQDTARELVRHAWSEIEALIGRAQGLATAAQPALIDAAVSDATRRHAVELERMRALAQVNPNIRQQEITHLEEQAQQVNEHLAGAQLRLDAVRVGIVTGAEHR